jgi:TadE-like protein
MQLPFRRRKPASRGQALVEAALVMPLLVVILLLALDFGRVYFTQVSLRNAAREASIYAGYHPTEGCMPTTTYTGMRYTVAKELGLGTPPNPTLVGCGGSIGDVIIVMNGSQASGCYQFTAPSTYVACSPAAGPWSPASTLVYRVELQYQFRPITPFVGLLTGRGFGNSIPITVVNTAPVLANYGS